MTPKELSYNIKRIKALKNSLVPIIEVVRAERDFYIEFLKDLADLKTDISNLEEITEIIRQARYILRIL